MAGWQEQLAALEMGAPWFEPWRTVGRQVKLALEAGAGLPEALNLHATGAVRFEPATELAPGVAYEQHIFDTARCPTRDSPHDFFNGLCWLEFPLTKERLNELQAGEIARAGVGGARGPVRDAITVFDENGALLHAPDALWQALLARDWQRLFIDLRPLWTQARIIVFGHALLEKLLLPRKELTAHVWRFQCPPGSTAQVDPWLAGELTAQRLAAKPFAPLPLLGVPGWSAQNQNFSFYDDSLIFRPARRHDSETTGARTASSP